MFMILCNLWHREISVLKAGLCFGILKVPFDALHCRWQFNGGAHSRGRTLRITSSREALIWGVALSFKYEMHSMLVFVMRGGQSTA